MEIKRQKKQQKQRNRGTLQSDTAGPAFGSS